jgi:hypothetical protein
MTGRRHERDWVVTQLQLFQLSSAGHIFQPYGVACNAWGARSLRQAGTNMRFYARRPKKVYSDLQ